MWTFQVDSDKDLAQYDFSLKGNFLAHVTKPRCGLVRVEGSASSTFSMLTLLESFPKAGTNLATNSTGVYPASLATLAGGESFQTSRFTEWCRAGSQ